MEVVTKNISKKENFKEENQSLRASETAKQFTKENPTFFKPFYSTGFQNLDNAIGGGLPNGLTVIGAISSLGKSTLALQIAAHLSQNGHHVLFYSLEMSALDIVAKSISRELYLTYNAENSSECRTVSELLNKSSWNSFNQNSKEKIALAANAVAVKEKNLTLIEGSVYGVTVDDIQQYIQNYIDCYDSKPVVFIDYLQILDPPREFNHLTDKQIADINMKQLKATADMFDIPIVIISSFNRESYDSAVTLKSFKGSGNIEYSGDIILGLEFFGVESKDFDLKKASSSPHRHIVMRVLKHRSGPRDLELYFDFNAKYHYFKETHKELWKTKVL